MTAIAYKDGIVAWDSRMTAGNSVITNNWQKHKRVGHVSVWLAGDASALADMEAWILNRSFVFPEQASFEALLWDGATMVLVAKDSGQIVDFLEVPVADVYALGSGARYAIGAMDAGCTALEAVKIACNRDTYCGGRLRTKKLW